MAPTFRKDDGFEDLVAQAQTATGPDVEIEIPLNEDEFLASIDPMSDVFADLDTGLLSLDDGTEAELANLIDLPHDTNLAEFMDEQDLRSLSRELMDQFEDDDMARQGWIEKYMKGLKLLGLEKEERNDPWDGACGVFHPVMTEANVRLQSKLVTSIFPALGPAKIKVMGSPTPERMARANRVKTELNFQLTEKMREFRDETEAALMKMPMGGACFKKVYFCPLKKRPVSMMVGAEKLLLPAGATSVVGAERITHIQEMTKNHIRKLMLSGFYRELDLAEPTPTSGSGLDEVGELEDEISGVDKVVHNPDEYTVLEFHVEVDLEVPGGAPDGRPVPYIVTIEKDSEKVLSVYRNWEDPGPAPTDPMTGGILPRGEVDYTRVEYFVRYQYLPGNDSPYGMGLMHLIGGLTEGATGLLRMLLDAGVLANLSGGWKAKTLRWKNDDRPHKPGEWRDVDVVSGNLKESLLPLPYKEPSQVLAGLLEKLVTEARNLASVPEIDAKTMSGETPVGTLMQILEQNLQIQSGIHARVHAAVKDELRMIARIIAKFMPEAYDYEVEGGFSRREDFSRAMNEIYPQSDPNASTSGMRMIQLQAVQQRAAANPEGWNNEELDKMTLEAIGIEGQDRLLKSSDVNPADPVTENMNVLMGKGAKVYEWQDHESHIAVHMAFMQDPKIQQLVGQSPNAGAMMAAAQSHIAEHVAYAYRARIAAETGTPLPPMGQALPPEIENRLASLSKTAAERVLGKSQTEIAAQQAQQAAQDPVVQAQQKELALEEQKLKQDYEYKMAKLKQDYELAMRRLGSEEDRAELSAATKMTIESAHLEAADMKDTASIALQIGDRVLKGQGGQANV